MWRQQANLLVNDNTFVEVLGLDGWLCILALREIFDIVCHYSDKVGTS